jgi:predicted transcriptional regulator
VRRRGAALRVGGLMERRERLSKQLLRVVSMLEIVHRLGNPDVKTVHRLLNASMTRKVCERTVWRDLNTLYTAGFLKRTDMQLKSGLNKQFFELQEPKKIIELCRKEKAVNLPEQQQERH